MINLFILGLPKAGTTSLHDFLCSHHGIKDTNIKEIHVFNEDYGSIKIEELIFHPDTIYTLDSSVSYVYNKEILRKIVAYNPKAKFIFIHRDFVARAKSHYIMDINKYGLQDRGIIWYWEHRESFEFYGVKGFGPIDAGRYSLFYEDMKDTLPTENLLELNFEDLVDNWIQIRNELSRFLNYELHGSLPRSNEAIHIPFRLFRFLVSRFPKSWKSSLRHSFFANFFRGGRSRILFSNDDDKLLDELKISELQVLKQFKNNEY